MHLLRMPLVIDTTSQSTQKTLKTFICNYRDFQQHVATAPMLLFQSFHDPQLKNPGSSPESNKTVVMKLHHNCIL